MAIVYGFAGVSYDDDGLAFDPNLPAEWDGLKFKLRIHDETLRVELTHSSISLRTEDATLTAKVRGALHSVGPDGKTIALDDG